jgi:hypothetical protein
MIVTIYCDHDQISLTDSLGIPITVYTGKELYKQLCLWIQSIQNKGCEFKLVVRNV